MLHRTKLGIWLVILSAVILILGGCGRKITRGMAQSEEAGTMTVSQSSPSLFPSDDFQHEDLKEESGQGYGVDSVNNAPPTERNWGPDDLAGMAEEKISEVFPGDEASDGMSLHNPNSSPLGSSYPEARHKAELVTAQTGLRDIFFELDSWHLTNEAKRILEANAKWLKSHRHETITIEGHCDERGTRSYNYALGYKRAMVTHKYLTSLGVPSKQLLVTSYGKDNPICWEFDETCFQQNRRAHVVLGIRLAGIPNEE